MRFSGKKKTENWNRFTSLKASVSIKLESIAALIRKNIVAEIIVIKISRTKEEEKNVVRKSNRLINKEVAEEQELAANNLAIFNGWCNLLNV